MRYLSNIFLGCILLVSCEREATTDKSESSKPIEFKKSEKNISERFLRLDGQQDTLRNYELGKNLFGKFFQKRAEFYVIENPNKTLYNRPVKSITLYFLDGTLSKTKFELDEDISNDLIRSYGAFTIKGYDTLTRKLLRTEDIMKVSDQEKILNEKLTNFELKWDRDSKFVFARVDKSGPKKRFEYIEALKDYGKRYKHIEAIE